MSNIIICEPSADFFFFPDNLNLLIEKIGRVCYKSEDKICNGSDEAFIRMILKNQHESVIEHAHVTVKIVCDRGISHEIVRHRLCNFTQKSTRYVNSTKRGFEFIPPFFSKPKLRTWYNTIKCCAKAYTEMNEPAQLSRSLLPNSLQTELFITTNLREWRHIFKMRCPQSAHPQMREIMIPLLRDFYRRLPTIFEDLTHLIDTQFISDCREKREIIYQWIEEFEDEEKYV